MNYSKKIDKRIEELEEKAERILNKGVIGTGPFKLQETLKSHERIKILLEELDYTLQKDIPAKEVLTKISSIEKEIDLIQGEVQKEER